MIERPRKEDRSGWIHSTGEKNEGEKGETLRKKKEKIVEKIRVNDGGKSRDENGYQEGKN